MQTEVEINNAVFSALVELYPDLKISKLYFEDDKMFISKIIDGKIITKQAMRDPNYSGYRYDWVEKFKI